MRLTRRPSPRGALAMLGTGPALAQAKTTVSVQYPLGFIFDKVFVAAEDRVREGEPGHHGQVPAGLQGIRGRRANRAARRGHQAAARRGAAGDQPPAPVRRPQDRRRPVALHRQGDRTGRARASAKSMMALSTYGDKPYGLAFAASTPIIYINDDLVDQGGRRSGQLPDHLGRHLRARPRRSPSSATAISACSIPGRSPATGCGRRWSISHGGKMMSDDEKTVAFDQDAGQEVDRAARPHGARGRHARPHARGEPRGLLRRQARHLDRIDLAAARRRRGRRRQVQVAHRALPGARPRRQAADRRRGGDDVRHRSGASRRRRGSS